MSDILRVSNPIVMYKEDGFLGFFISFLMIILFGFLAWLFVMLTEPIWKPLLFHLKYSDTITKKVKVVNKNYYTTTTTTYVTNNNVTTPIITTNHHYDVELIDLKTNDLIEYDNEELFGMVSLEQEGTLTYKEEHWKYKWQSKDKFRFHKNVDHKFNYKPF